MQVLQRAFAAMLRRLPAPIAEEIERNTFLRCTGAFKEPVPQAPDDLYKETSRLISGAGIAFGRGGQSVADYEATLRHYGTLYRALIDALGETERYKRNSFDDQTG
ncbi:hypothetical protein NFI95_08250 [Acetobacteraceae bacterium KSS8]|uniref:Uncharacterized protein n=1 Tax=Endosaccharibacter trunci TaxID=2812733 RepID=A0ABT1W6D7_9PROT|nr:hypothetical protein [Acetobacteraceae bacterium KSS8]